MDAFQTEYSLNLSQYPLIKSAVALTVLIQGMCRTLSAVPAHGGEIVSFIEDVLEKYYEKALMRYKCKNSISLWEIAQRSSLQH